MTIKKRISALALAGLMGTLTLAPAGTAFAKSWDKVDGSYQMLDGTAIDGVVARGIDTSRWQGVIDWAAVKADDVDFVMLGTRSRSAGTPTGVDPTFHTNATEAYKHGVKVGAYIYSLALTPEEAEAEADFVLDLVKDYPISFPIAFDIEDNSQASLSKAQISDIINAFCRKIEAAGYHPMVYANEYWLTQKIDSSAVNYDIWVARYQAKHTVANPAMWQATNEGRINGINGNVDIDFLYKDYTLAIPANTWRTIAGKTYFYKDYLMQKSAWIDDGQGHYYMDDTGSPSKGWLKQSGTYYYLDESTGKMVTGWKALDGTWYYLNNDGKMATGWAQVNNSWYYMNQSGAMETGWKDLNGKRYYLTDSGAAAGWLALDQTWYHFNGSNEMEKGWVMENGNWYLMDASSGKMKTGWHSDQSGTYYLSTNSGKMSVGWREIDGSWYYFNGSGQRMTGKVTLDGKIYYLNPSDGKMAANTSVKIDGVDYTVDGNGVCVKVESGADAPGTPDAQSGAPETGESQGADSGQVQAPGSEETKEVGPGM